MEKIYTIDKKIMPQSKALDLAQNLSTLQSEVLDELARDKKNNLKLLKPLLQDIQTQTLELLVYLLKYDRVEIMKNICWGLQYFTRDFRTNGTQ